MTTAGTTDPQALALIDEATKKSGVVWLRVGDRRPQAVWHLWHEGSAYVLSGGTEQPAPGLHEATTAAVGVRSKDNGSRLLAWQAQVTRVLPDSPLWAVVVPLLQAKRLNSPDGAAAPHRWAASSSVHRLTPTGVLLESPTDRDEQSRAAPPPATPATTRVPIPFTLGRSRAR